MQSLSYIHNTVIHISATFGFQSQSHLSHIYVIKALGPDLKTKKKEEHEKKKKKEEEEDKNNNNSSSINTIFTANNVDNRSICNTNKNSKNDDN